MGSSTTETIEFGRWGDGVRGIVGLAPSLLESQVHVRVFCFFMSDAILASQITTIDCTDVLYIYIYIYIDLYTYICIHTYIYIEIYIHE